MKTLFFIISIGVLFYGFYADSWLIIVGAIFALFIFNFENLKRNIGIISLGVIFNGVQELYYGIYADGWLYIIIGAIFALFIFNSENLKRNIGIIAIGVLFYGVQELYYGIYADGWLFIIVGSVFTPFLLSPTITPRNYIWTGKYESGRVYRPNEVVLGSKDMTPSGDKLFKNMFSKWDSYGIYVCKKKTDWNPVFFGSYKKGHWKTRDIKISKEHALQMYTRGIIAEQFSSIEGFVAITLLGRYGISINEETSNLVNKFFPETQDLNQVLNTTKIKLSNLGIIHGKELDRKVVTDSNIENLDSTNSLDKHNPTLLIKVLLFHLQNKLSPVQFLNALSLNLKKENIEELEEIWGEKKAEKLIKLIFELVESDMGKENVYPYAWAMCGYQLQKTSEGE